MPRPHECYWCRGVGIYLLDGCWYCEGCGRSRLHKAGKISMVDAEKKIDISVFDESGADPDDVRRAIEELYEWVKEK